MKRLHHFTGESPTFTSPLVESESRGKVIAAYGSRTHYRGWAGLWKGCASRLGLARSQTGQSGLFLERSPAPCPCVGCRRRRPGLLQPPFQLTAFRGRQARQQAIQADAPDAFLSPDLLDDAIDADLFDHTVQAHLLDDAVQTQ